jgi:RNA recognition motif-containing protein
MTDASAVVCGKFCGMERTSNLIIFVGNLHLSTTERDLITIFQAYGTISTINYLWHKTGPKRGQPKGFAFIEYENEESVKNALKQDGLIIRGKRASIQNRSSKALDASHEVGPYSLMKKRARQDDSQTREIDQNSTHVLKAVKSIDDRIARLKVFSFTRLNTFSLALEHANTIKHNSNQLMILCSSHVHRPRFLICKSSYFRSTTWRTYCLKEGHEWTNSFDPVSVKHGWSRVVVMMLDQFNFINSLLSRVDLTNSARGELRLLNTALQLIVITCSWRGHGQCSATQETRPGRSFVCFSRRCPTH